MATNPDVYKANAERVSKDPPKYEINMSAGISYHVWLFSQAFSHESNILLPWIDQIRISDQRLQKIGINSILAGFAYHLGSYLIILHEISHICLGHVDYLKDVGIEHLSPYKIRRIIKAFEADADEQAGRWLVGFFECWFGENGFWKDLSFPSRFHMYEFYMCAIVLVFTNLQYFLAQEDLTHPQPNERVFIQLNSLSKYFSQNLPEEHDEIFLHALNSCFDACKKTLVVDFKDLDSLARILSELTFVEDVIKETKIRDYQHNFALANLSLN